MCGDDDKEADEADVPDVGGVRSFGCAPAWVPSSFVFTAAFSGGIVLLLLLLLFWVVVVVVFSLFSSVSFPLFSLVFVRAADEIEGEAL